MIDNQIFKKLLSNTPKISLDESEVWEGPIENELEGLFEGLFPLTEKEQNAAKPEVGDVVLVDSYFKDSENKYINNKQHLCLVVFQNNANNLNKTMYYGFPFTSNTNMASVRNSRKNQAILIDSCRAIYKRLYVDNLTDIAVVLKMEEPVTFWHKNLAGFKIIGHVTDAFWDFIVDVKQNKIKREDLRWDKAMIDKYTKK